MQVYYTSAQRDWDWHNPTRAATMEDDAPVTTANPALVAQAGFAGNPLFAAPAGFEAALPTATATTNDYAEFGGAPAQQVADGEHASPVALDMAADWEGSPVLTSAIEAFKPDAHAYATFDAAVAVQAAEDTYSGYSVGGFTVLSEDTMDAGYEIEDGALASAASAGGPDAHTYAGFDGAAGH